MLADVLAAAHPEAAVAAQPSAAIVVVSGAVAALLVLGLWSVAGHLITIAHEGAHAAATVLLGGTVSEVRLNRDGTGSTESRSPLLQFPVTAAGYLGPSAFGLAGSLAVMHGKPDAVLWITLLLLALLLVSTANWFGRFLVLLVGAAMFLTLQRGSPDVVQLVACVWVWVLLIGGVLHVWNHRRGGADFASMRSMTHIVPAAAWAGLALILSAGALVVGGSWLVGAATPPL